MYVQDVCLSGLSDIGRFETEFSDNNSTDRITFMGICVEITGYVTALSTSVLCRGGSVEKNI